MKNKKKSERAIALLAMSILLSGFVAAFGVNFPVDIQNKELKLLKKEERQLGFFVQIAEGEGGNATKIEIVNGSNIISLIGPDTISVPPGELVPVTFIVKVPKGAKVGDVYPIKIIFRKVGDGGGGAIGIGISIGVTFDIVIIKRPKKIK